MMLDLDPAVPGNSSGPTNFPGEMWHCPTGLLPALTPTRVSHAGCGEHLEVSPAPS